MRAIGKASKEDLTIFPLPVNCSAVCVCVGACYCLLECAVYVHIHIHASLCMVYVCLHVYVPMTARERRQDLHLQLCKGRGGFHIQVHLAESLQGFGFGTPSQSHWC